MSTLLTTWDYDSLTLAERCNALREARLAAREHYEAILRREPEPHPVWLRQVRSDDPRALAYRAEHELARQEQCAEPLRHPCAAHKRTPGGIGWRW